MQLSMISALKEPVPLPVVLAKEREMKLSEVRLQAKRKNIFMVD